MECIDKNDSSIMKYIVDDNVYVYVFLINSRWFFIEAIFYKNMPVIESSKSASSLSFFSLATDDDIN